MLESSGAALFVEMFGIVRGKVRMSFKDRSNQGRVSASTVITALLAIGFFALALTSPQLRALGGPYGPPPPPVTPPPPPPPPVIPPRTPFNPKVPVFVPTDVTSAVVPRPDVAAAWALSGIKLVPDNQFPKEDELKGTSEWILVRARPGAVYSRPTPYSVKLERGDILVTVKRPSNMAMINTPLGKVSIAADGDVILSYNEGVLRVQNLDGLGKSVMAQIVPPGQADPTVELAAGFELVAGTRKLTRADMKPKDGIARRHFKILEDGHLAVSEFSVESAIHNSDLIADIKQNVSGVKERRILSDMSKMAAVLNYMRGEEGFKPNK